MSNPSSYNWIIWLFACCWPSPVFGALIALIVTAIHKGWIRVKVDTSNAPHLLRRPHD